MEELKKNDNITVKEWKAKMEAQRKNYRAKMQSILTDDQKAQLEKSRQGRKVKFEQRAKERSEKMSLALLMNKLPK